MVAEKIKPDNAMLTFYLTSSFQ